MRDATGGRANVQLMVNVAVFGGNVFGLKPEVADTPVLSTKLRRQFSALPADVFHPLDSAGTGKFPGGNSFARVDLLHHVVPHLHVPGIFQGVGRIVPPPDAAQIIGRISDKPAVLKEGGGPRFACGGNALQFCGVGGTARIQGRLQDIGDQVYGFFGENGLPLGRIVQMNPEWLEWFMGYPIGWTELNA